MTGGGAARWGAAKGVAATGATDGAKGWAAIGGAVRGCWVAVGALPRSSRISSGDGARRPAGRRNAPNSAATGGGAASGGANVEGVV